MDDRLRRGDPLRRAPRRAGARDGRRARRTRTRRAELQKIADVCSRVPAHAPARLPRGAAVVLVLPPRGDHRAERLGLLQPRPPRPAPAAVLRAGLADGTLTPRGGAGAARVLLRQVQQPPGAAQGRRHRGRERHLHRLRRTSTSAACCATAPTARTRSRTCCSRSSTRCTCSSPAQHPALAQDPGRLPASTRCAWSARATASPRSSTPTRWSRSSCARARRSRTPARAAAAAAWRSGAFGKEAYILTGYFNLPKVLELALHDGVDPRTGRQLGPATGDPADFAIVRRPSSPPSRRRCATSSTSRSAATS